MAVWVNVNLKKIIPDALLSILSTIQTVITAAKVPLELANSALTLAKTIIAFLPIFDFLKMLGNMISDYKNDFLASNIYTCYMFDYPTRQVYSGDPGPDSTYGNNINLKGSLFKESYITDLINSFDDNRDFQRPMYKKDVSCLLLVRAVGSLSDLNLVLDESNFGEPFTFMALFTGKAGYSLAHARSQLMWKKFRDSAEAQGEFVAQRVARVQAAFRAYNQMTDDQKDSVPVPFNQKTGEYYYEGAQAKDVPFTEVVELMSHIEFLNQPAAYPDWSKMPLANFCPELILLVNGVLDPIIDLLQSGLTIKDQIIALINSIQAKLDEFQAILDRIQEIIDQIDAFLNMTGFYGVLLTSSNGIEDIKTQLRNMNSPITTGYGFYSGMTMVAGGPSATVFNTLFGPIVG
jgi:hypothetical protein